MNMLKKLALLGIILMFVSLPVYAETALTLIDDFNTFTTTEGRLNGTIGYPKNADESDVFAYDATYSKHYGASTIKTGAGPDESTALAVGGMGTDISLMTVSMDTTGPMVYEFSYDIKFNRLNNISLAGNSLWSVSKPLFNLTSDGRIQATSNGSTYEDAGTYEANEWYKVIVIRAGSKKYGYFVNSQGEAIYSSLSNDSASKSSKVSAIYMKAGVAGNTTGTIDNAKIVSYNPAENVPSLFSSSVTAGETDVQRNKALTFVFDQEIEEGSEINFIRADGAEITEITGISTEKTFYNTLVINYEGLLDRSTEYILAFGNVGNSELTCTDEAFSFTTEDLHHWNDIEVSSASTNEELTDITFSIGDEYGYPIFNGSVMAVAYQDGKMLKADIRPLQNVPAGELSMSFGLGSIPADAKIVLILLDIENGPIPLAGGEYKE